MSLANRHTPNETEAQWMGDFLAILFPDGCFKSLSPAFFSVSGEGHREWLNQNIQDFFHPGEHQFISWIFRQVVDGNSVQLPNVCCKLKCGRLVILDLTLVPRGLNNETREILVFGNRSAATEYSRPLPPRALCSLGSFRQDLSQSSHFRTAFLKFVEHYFANASVGFSFVSENLRYSCVNESLAQMHGYTPTQHLGRTLSELLPAAGQKVEPELRKVLDTDIAIKDFEVPIQVGTKTLYTLQNFYPIVTAQRKGVAVIVVNISDQKSFKNSLAVAEAEISRSGEELQVLAHSTALHLGEPLTSISTFTERLEQKESHPLDEDSRTCFKQIFAGISKIQNLNQDLLKYSSIAGSHETVKAYSIASLIKQALENIYPLISESETAITYGTLPTVVCAREPMILLFQNLITNAIIYRREVRAHIHISSRSIGSESLFAIQDNGIGFDMKYATCVFNPFQKLHPQDEHEHEHEHGGTGIGLAICKRIVERHGGRIWAESKQGQGSTFFFTLPVSPAAHS